jgi:hypothetical protein
MFSILWCILFTFIVSLIWCSFSFPFANRFRWRCLTHRGTFEVGGCSSCFWYPFSMFCLKAFLFVALLPPPFRLSTLACSFWFCPYGGFWETLKPKFLKMTRCFPNALVDFFSHFSSSGVGFISFEAIVLIAYCGNWAFITPINVSKFLIDFCLFLLEALMVSNLGLFSSLTHLRLAQELHPKVVVLCIPPFK